LKFSFAFAHVAVMRRVRHVNMISPGCETTTILPFSSCSIRPKPYLAPGISKLSCQRVAEAATQQFEGRTSYIM